MAEKSKHIDVKELSIILDIMKNPDSEFATDDYIDVFSDGISAAIKELEAFPAADVAPVRHGNWFGTVCSACGESTSFYYDCNFCPNCGAKMDGGDENDH